MIDAFYSLSDINQRFNRLALDSLYIRHLDMTTITNMNSLYNQISSIDPQLLSRICQKILPRIHHEVYKLTVEQDSMNQILLAANYPRLYSLSLINFEEEIIYQYLTDNLVLRDLLTKQITHLNIDIRKPVDHWSDTLLNIIALILSLCKILTVLNFGDMFITRKFKIPFFFLSSEISMSSTLMKLTINVLNFADCRCVVDGRFPCLSTLIINVDNVLDPMGDIGETKKLPKLKSFSFTSFFLTFNYDTLIVPLLCQMINLEELKLYLHVGRSNSTFIDGIQLYDQFLIHMTQLKKFTFNIKTTAFKNKNNTRVELPSNEDIQHSFIGRGYQQVVPYVDTKSSAWDGECHIYSLPYDFEYFVNLDNSFQGGMFHKVRKLTICGRDPLEYKLFQIIFHDFPFLNLLYISNRYPIKDKQYSSKLITFPYLTFLDLQYTHVDYIELFLLKKNTYLPRLLNLCMEYKSLTMITNNFTNNPTHFNFGKLKSLDICESFVRPENFHEYFPLL
ncbi:unnamed protein product [Rotaria sp. Silwood2]|nr:unnamed protein product [Rotaria sp. Silwood2]CAF3057099.1 unnamed protein product [Rotaria sp. Silwood2]CAF4184682.1 unnamed protein product [Rotaria sp. Silwood2]CAF4591634.1 unnamed protein product [Rotaria sp. Silwood2]